MTKSSKIQSAKLEKFEISFPNKKLKAYYEVGLVITTYNRPKYLQRTLKSLKKSNLSNSVVLIIDDLSDEPETLQIIKAFQLNQTSVLKFFRKTKDGCKMYEHLQIGWDYLLNNFNCKYLTNLDPDALVLPDWLQKLQYTFELGNRKFGGCLVTGFNAYKHPILEEATDY